MLPFFLHGRVSITLVILPVILFELHMIKIRPGQWEDSG